jgi:hypothetical protein
MRYDDLDAVGRIKDLADNGTIEPELRADLHALLSRLQASEGEVERLHFQMGAYSLNPERITQTEIAMARDANNQVVQLRARIAELEKLISTAYWKVRNEELPYIKNQIAHEVNSAAYELWCVIANLHDDAIARLQSDQPKDDKPGRPCEAFVAMDERCREPVPCPHHPQPGSGKEGN